MVAIDRTVEVDAFVNSFGVKYGALADIFERDPVEAARLQKEAKRAVWVRKEVRKGGNRLVGSWGDMLKVVAEEVGVAKVLISEAEGRGDGTVLESEKYKVWKRGLVEYGRVCKMIWSTVDTMRFGMGGVGVVEGAEVGKELEEFFGGLGGGGGSIEEFKQLGVKGGEGVGVGAVCKITLLPLGVKGYSEGILNTVEWQGGKYFACVANLWTNRVSLQQPN